MRLKKLVVSLMVVGMILGAASLALARPRILTTSEMKAAIGGNGCMIFHNFNKQGDCGTDGCVNIVYGRKSYKITPTTHWYCGWWWWGTCADSLDLKCGRRYDYADWGCNDNDFIAVYDKYDKGCVP